MTPEQREVLAEIREVYAGDDQTKPSDIFEDVEFLLALVAEQESRAEKAEAELDEERARNHPCTVRLSCASCGRVAGPELFQFAAECLYCTARAATKRAANAEAAIARIHAAIARGDHGVEGNADCIIDAIVSARMAESEATVAQEKAEAEVARLTALVEAARACVTDWREQASAEDECQRSGGNPKGARAYRHCADDLAEALGKEAGGG